MYSIQNRLILKPQWKNPQQSNHKGQLNPRKPISHCST
jgi:hypothetical protein